MKLIAACLKARSKAVAQALPPALDPHAPTIQNLLAQWAQPQFIRSIETSMDYQSQGMVVKVEYLVPHYKMLEAKP